MRRRPHTFILAGALLALLTAMAACGGASVPAPKQSHAKKVVEAATAPGIAPIKVVFSTDFIASGGDDAPFYVALKEGFYKAEGLSVRIVRGVNPAESTQWLAQGKVDITRDAPSTAAKAASEGAPVKVIALPEAPDPYGLIYLAGSPIRTPKDLYHKAVGVPPGTSAAIAWKGLVQALKLKKADIKIVSASPAAQMGLLATHKVAAVSGAGYIFISKADALGVHVGYLPYTKYGIDQLGMAIATTDRLLAKQPDTVRKFLAATAKGFAFCAAHPKQAISDEATFVVAVKKNPSLAEQQLKMFIRLVDQGQQGGRKPWGWQTASEWKGQMAILSSFEGVSHVGPLSQYYTNAYLPAASGG